jgi:hypothetical protein
VLANQGTLVFARDDDYFFGVLQSRFHELWARRHGTQLREAESGFRYTPTSTFETFPFPWSPGREPKRDAKLNSIANAAKALAEIRQRKVHPTNPDELDPEIDTLTKLYNKNRQWLQDAHAELDAAVAAAYGWPADLSDAEILERLLALNLERAAAAGERD